MINIETFVTTDAKMINIQVIEQNRAHTPLLKKSKYTKNYIKGHVSAMLLKKKIEADVFKERTFFNKRKFWLNLWSILT